MTKLENVTVHPVSLRRGDLVFLTAKVCRRCSIAAHPRFRRGRVGIVLSVDKHGVGMIEVLRALSARGTDDLVFAKIDDCQIIERAPRRGR